MNNLKRHILIYWLLINYCTALLVVNNYSGLPSDFSVKSPHADPVQFLNARTNLVGLIFDNKNQLSGSGEPPFPIEKKQLSKIISKNIVIELFFKRIFIEYAFNQYQLSRISIILKIIYPFHYFFWLMPPSRSTQHEKFMLCSWFQNFSHDQQNQFRIIIKTVRWRQYYPGYECRKSSCGSIFFCKILILQQFWCKMRQSA